MARYSQSHKGEVRTLILAEARRVVAEEGPDALSIVPLMSAVGLTHGGFYSHFASREELLVATIQAMCDDVLAVFSRPAFQSITLNSLLAYIDTYVSAKHRDSPLTGCAVSGLATTIAGLSDENQTKYASAHKALKSGLATVFTRLGVPDAQDLASSVLTEMVGAITLARALGKTEASDRVLASSRKHLRQRILDVASRANN